MLETFAVVAAAGLVPVGIGGAVRLEICRVLVVLKLVNVQGDMAPSQASTGRRILHLHIRLVGSKVSVHCRGTRLNPWSLRMKTTSERSVKVVIRKEHVPVLV